MPGFEKLTSLRPSGERRARESAIADDVMAGSMASDNIIRFMSVIDSWLFDSFEVDI